MTHISHHRNEKERKKERITLRREGLLPALSLGPLCVSHERTNPNEFVPLSCVSDGALNVASLFLLPVLL